MTLEQIEAEEKKLATARAALEIKRDTVLGKRILGCNCGRWQRVRETEVIIDLKFRCPGQSGGYFIDAGRHYKCNHCGNMRGFGFDEEINILPERLFKSVERKELS